MRAGRNHGHRDRALFPARVSRGRRAVDCRADEFRHARAVSPAIQLDIAHCGCPEHRQPDSHEKNVYRHQLWDKGGAREPYVGDLGPLGRCLKASSPHEHPSMERLVALVYALAELPPTTVKIWTVGITHPYVL